MKNYVLLISVLLVSIISHGQNQWPVLKKYDKDHLGKIALPIGGIGTGTVSLGGRGELRDWEIMNRPAKGFRTTKNRLTAPFFAIYTKANDSKPHTKALLGPLYDYEYEHMEGRSIEHHGLPRFESATFETAYPFGQVNLEDKTMPVDVKVKAFNPLIPGDEDASGIPIAILSYEVTNTTNATIDVSICGSMRNFIGVDGSKKHKDWKGETYSSGANYNKNTFIQNDDLKGIFMSSDSVHSLDPAWGTIALSTSAQENTSYRTGNIPDNWGNTILHFWDDFSDDGILNEEKWSFDHEPMASLAVSKQLKAGETKAFTFYLTWHFPNRTSWYGNEIVGNYYTEQYKNALDVIEKEYPRLTELENKTIEFVSAFIESDLPEVVKEASLFNISTLRSQTVFRIKDGHIFGWEGVMDEVGSCMGSCTHVWNYEQTIPFLFGNLAKSMRDIEFGYATHDNGLMSFRVDLPLEKAQNSGMAAADGQMGTIMKFYRDWQLSGDYKFLQKHWPNIKNALAFSWIDGGWDANADGVMEGCQHNTMDVEYFGPNPQMQIWYLGALKAANKMAIAVGDDQFAKICDELFNNGSKWTDKNLFNGEYYEQIIMPPKDANEIAPGLSVGMGSSDINEPDFQLAKGCLVDQLVGQYMSHICGLGYLVQPKNVKTTLNSIMKYNYMESLNSHFNNMRSYAMGNESALLMASWPKGRPTVPFPYFSEVMTGFEYTAAVGMLYEGQYENGLKCITSIRDRYNGSKRNPFNEAECGNHYARAMASWSSGLALTGFNYSAVEKQISFSNIEGSYFWSNGYSYGTIEISNSKTNKKVDFKVLKGEIQWNRFIIKGYGELTFPDTISLAEGSNKQFIIENNNPKIGLPEYHIAVNDITVMIKGPQIKDLAGNTISSTSFTDQTEIIIEARPDETIYYTLDGSEPSLNSLKYSKPILITRSTILKTVAEKNGNLSFFSNTAELIKTLGFKNLKLENNPSRKYAAKGTHSLFDGIKASQSISDKNWLGFEGNNLELLIDFGEKKSIEQVSISFLVNESSWIFAPISIEIYSSSDGTTYNKVSSINKLELQAQKKSGLNTIPLKVDQTNTDKLKIIIKSIETCPPNHLGSGKKAWLFVDEIIIE